MTIDDLIAKAVIDHAEPIAAGELSGYELFDLVFGPMPVAYRDGEWSVVEPEDFDTGCTTDFGDDNALIHTLADLASRLDRTPWSLACDYGWPDDQVRAEKIDDPAVVAALASARKEIAAQIHEADEQRRCEREEAEIMDRDDLEYLASNRGEDVTYCGAATIAEAAEELGMPEDSDTVRRYFERTIHRGEALRRAKKITHRHENTNYDDLLHRGIDRDTAREMME